MSLTTISYGGGVQSTAMLVLAAQGELGYDVDVALFANVGDDSEHPTTLKFVREIATPWAAERGITVHELRREFRDGREVGLRGYMEAGTKAGNQNDIIPIYTPEGVPLSRGCTRDFKLRPIGKWLKANGAKADDKATVCIGISTDEIQRVNPNRAEAYERLVYPLIELGYSRRDCVAIIENAGLPNPGKSSCFFCPFHRPQMWSEMRRDEPELFFSAADLEATLNARRVKTGKEVRYLTRFGKPLAEAIGEAQDMLPGFGPDIDGCDSGACWT